MEGLLIMVAIVVIIVLYNYNTKENYSNWSGGPNYRWPWTVGDTPMTDHFPYEYGCIRKPWPK